MDLLIVLFSSDAEEKRKQEKSSWHMLTRWWDLLMVLSWSDPVHMVASVRMMEHLFKLRISTILTKQLTVNGTSCHVWPWMQNSCSTRSVQRRVHIMSLCGTHQTCGKSQHYHCLQLIRQLLWQSMMMELNARQDMATYTCSYHMLNSCAHKTVPVNCTVCLGSTNISVSNSPMRPIFWKKTPSELFTA